MKLPGRFYLTECLLCLQEASQRASCLTTLVGERQRVASCCFLLPLWWVSPHTSDYLMTAGHPLNHLLFGLIPKIICYTHIICHYSIFLPWKDQDQKKCGCWSLNNFQLPVCGSQPFVPTEDINLKIYIYV